MDDLIETGIQAALRAGARYADVRAIAPLRYEHLAVRNGEASALTSSVRSGVGVRARTDRAWGFATAAELTRDAARSSGQLAARLAKAASRSVDRPLALTSDRSVRGGVYETSLTVDPFEVPRDQKVELLVRAEKALHVESAVKTGHASYEAWEERKWFGNSEGSSYRSRIVHVGAGVEATAIENGNVQQRSAPNSFGGDYRQGGWEFIESLGLPERSPEVGREAVALLHARRCPTGSTTLVLGSSQLALQVHESVGHATELDRILAMEAGYAGTSFLTPKDLGRLKYGSLLMNIVADATEPGGLGTFGWDDEGVPARRTPIVRRGRLVGALTSRETAARIGLRHSGATSRAEGFHRTPLIRMTNVDLQPGDHSFPELVEGVRDGVYLETNRSWSIDDRRLNFQFGTEAGFRIRKGEVAELVRNPLYAGMTPEFWASMDAVGNRSTWHLWGVPNCGKGQPGQTARVGHGAPMARFRRVAVRGG